MRQGGPGGIAAGGWALEVLEGGWRDAAGGGDSVRCSGLFFFGVFGGDSGGGPIWSGRSAVFGFVQVCSDLFRVVQGVFGVDGCAWGAGLGGGRGGGHCSHFRSSGDMVARLVGVGGWGAHGFLPAQE